MENKDIKKEQELLTKVGNDIVHTIQVVQCICPSCGQKHNKKL